MLWGAPLAGLEVRRASDGAAELRGRFPYGEPTELAPGRREVFAPGALWWREDVHLLSGHDFARPLASLRRGSLELRGGDDALEFEARISPRVAATQAGADALALIEEGLAAGVSPGFRVEADGAEVRREGDGLLRTVKRAELVELSVVTKPAYPAAQVQARAWELVTAPAQDRGARFRWRA